jgi:hypothetical protein
MVEKKQILLGGESWVGAATDYEVSTKLRSRGLVVGADVPLITFDDVRPLQFFDPPLTASPSRRWSPGVELITEAAGTATSIIVERLPVEFIRRASIGPPRHLSVKSGTHTPRVPRAHKG